MGLSAHGYAESAVRHRRVGLGDAGALSGRPAERSHGSVTVLPCSALPAPGVEPVQAGDTSITLTSFVPDAEIKVFVNGVKKGDGSGPVVSADAGRLPAATRLTCCRCSEAASATRCRS